MSTETTFICDLCQSKQNTPEQFWNVFITVAVFNPLPQSLFMDKMEGTDCCRSCLERLQLLPLKDRPAEEKRLTAGEKLEGLIQEIANDIE